MKKIVLLALAASTAMIAAPAAAQTVTGTVNITGSVAPKCQVVPTGGGGVSSTFNATVNLGELSDPDGTLVTSASLSSLFNAGGTGAAILTFRVVCTTANPGVTVDADPIVNVATAPAGYANRVDYQADVLFDLVPSTADQTVSNDSAVALTAASLNDRLVGAGNNVTITAQNFRTPNVADIMVAGSYAGLITVVISPS